MKSPKRKFVLEPAPGMYGVPLDDPRQGDEPLALYNDQLSCVIMELIKKYHHAKTENGFEIVQCFIGPPRGTRSGMARIELLYRRENHGWRHVFAVTHSAEHGLRLWTEVRRYVRQA